MGSLPDADLSYLFVFLCQKRSQGIHSETVASTDCHGSLSLAASDGNCLGYHSAHSDAIAEFYSLFEEKARAISSGYTDFSVQAMRTFRFSLHHEANIAWMAGYTILNSQFRWRTTGTDRHLSIVEQTALDTE